MTLLNSLPWFAALVLLLSALASPARSAEIIAEVVVRRMGDAPVEESHVRSYTSSKAGDILVPETIAREVRSLIDSGSYSYVDTRIEPADGGVRLVYVVRARRRLAEVLRVRGNKALSNSKVLDIANLPIGSMVDEQIVATAAAKVQAEYRERHFLDAVVEGDISSLPQNPGFAVATLQITEGEKFKVPLIRFKGNKALGEGDLRRFSRQRRWWNPAGWFSTKRYDAHDLELLRADARGQYANLGYLDAKISEPEIVKRKKKQNISFNVQEGVQYRIGNLSFEGVSLFPIEKLIWTTGLVEGDVASKARIDQSARNLRDYYAERGYADTAVRVAYSADTSYGRVDRVNLAYTVREGSLARVRSILIRGNTRTKDKVIRRDIVLNPGDVYNEIEAERSDRRLTNLGYFESVRHYEVPALDGVNYDIVYEVEEKPTGQFLIGAGFSSIDRMIGFAELSQGNFDLFNWGRFTGGGQKARIGLQASSRASDVDISFVEPWFLDRQLALNVDAFLRNRSFNEYDERRLGGSVGLSKHVPWVGRLGVTYTLQQITLKNVIEGDFALLPGRDTIFRYTDELDDYLQGSLRLNWLYQTIDNPIVPTRGTRATAGLTLYGDALGGGPDMYEISLRGRHYIPMIYKHVLSLYVRSETIEAFGSDEVPIGNRYFLGGGRNVRGFRYRTVGPKVQSVDLPPESRATRPLGGQTLLHASAEYTIPLSRFFRLAAFYDIGNVWSDAYDYDFSNFASSVGGGIRLDFPMFPIRFDYAYPLSRDDDYSRRQIWVFWVGFD